VFTVRRGDGRAGPSWVVTEVVYCTVRLAGRHSDAAAGWLQWAVERLQWGGVVWWS